MIENGESNNRPNTFDSCCDLISIFSKTGGSLQIEESANKKLENPYPKLNKTLCHLSNNWNASEFPVKGSN